MAKKKVYTAKERESGKKALAGELRALKKKYAWLLEPVEKEPSKREWERRFAAQNRKHEVINVMCAEIDKVFPRNGETVAHFEKRTGKKFAR